MRTMHESVQKSSLYARAVFVLVLSLCSMSIHMCAHVAYADEAVGDAQVREWFESDASSVLSAQGAQKFPNMNEDDVQALAMSDPVRVWGLSNSTTAGTHDIVPTNRWMVALESGHTPVGVLWADFAVGDNKNATVRADKNLAKSVYEISRHSEPGRRIFYDHQLSAWFSINDLAISPADGAGAKIVAGEVPVDDFMIQRDRNVGLVSDDPTLSGDHSENNLSEASQSSISLVSATIVALVIVVLVVLSLLWLRWEAIHAKKRREDNEPFSGDLSESSLAVVDAEQAGTSVSLGRAAGKVNVYRRKNTVGDESHDAHEMNEVKESNEPHISDH